MRSHYSYDSRTTSQRLHYERSQTISLSRCTVAVYSLYSLSTVGRLAFLVVQKRRDLLRSVFWCDRKTAIERDHAAIASDQTKFKVAEGRSKVAVRCDWGISPVHAGNYIVVEFDYSRQCGQGFSCAATCEVTNLRFIDIFNNNNS